jgi:hypothetical protein
MELAELGWNDRFAALLASTAEPDLTPMRVAIEYKDRYQLMGERGSLFGYLRGELHERGPFERPAVGDWVATRMDESGETAIIVELLERSSRFVRQAAGKRTRPQVVAANVDTVFVVTSANQDFNVRRIERYLTTVWNSGATGPNVSSREIIIDGVTSAKTVGSKKRPPRACRLPPIITRAPFFSASSMCSSTLATALSSISGPCVAPASRPLAGFSVPTAAASFAANAS